MSIPESHQKLANQGQFHARVPPSQPLTTKGHAPGVKLGNDAIPEFSAQILPAGSAPSDRTFQPPAVVAQTENPDLEEELRTSAEESLPGITSKDANKGIGQPISGQTDSETRGRGASDRSGLEGVGANPNDQVRERALDIDVQKGTRGKSGVNRENILGAEERLPESAETVAAERA